jgi:formylmethanofuran dehydrogenase subunit B
VVVIWREDPETTHPRLLDRLGFGGGPNEDRTLVVVDDRVTATARRADLQLRWPRRLDLETLTGLHVVQRQRPVRVDDLTSELDGLLELIDAVPHVAFVHGAGLTAGEGGQRRLLALHEFVRELSHDRHVVTLELPAAAGTRTAQEVLAWQTGYSQNIDLASGHPELASATGSLLSDEGVDVSLCVEGHSDELGEGVTQIALGSRLLEGVDVSIRTAAAGVAATGTAHRLDGVPLALQAPLPDDAPTSAALLARLLEEMLQA